MLGGTLLLCAGLPLLLFGTVYGTVHWIASAQSGQAAAAGVVMLAALPVILGLQLLLSFLSLDIGNTPGRRRARPRKLPLHPGRR